MAHIVMTVWKMTDDVILQFSYISHVTLAAKVASSLSLQKNSDQYTHDFKTSCLISRRHLMLPYKMLEFLWKWSYYM
jgi:hypothetical protein